jgi:hypothetical protein
MSSIPSFSGIAEGDVLDFTFDFSKWLTKGDMIVSGSITSEPDTLTISNPLVANTALVAWFQDAVQDTDYLVTARVVTGEGRTVNRSAMLSCSIL